VSRRAPDAIAQQKALDALLELLDLEELEVNIFRGRSPEEDRHLLPAPGRSRDAHPVPGGSHSRRAQLLDAARDRDPAR
jgi:hypothetical protein